MGQRWCQWQISRQVAGAKPTFTLSLATHSSRSTRSSRSPIFLHAVPGSTPGRVPRLRCTRSRCIGPRSAPTSRWRRRWKWLLGWTAAAAASSSPSAAPPSTRRDDGTSSFRDQLSLPTQSTAAASGRSPRGLGPGTSALSTADAVHVNAATAFARWLSMRG